MASALELHPDKQPLNQPNDQTSETIVQFQQVNNAWEILRDPVKRKEHDRFLSISGKIGPVQYIIDLASMEYDQECDAFYSLCRCGGRFEISVSDLDTDASIDAVECSQCSLFATISTKAEL
ncbi:hypothetical protein BDV3_005557 [Batrachochytrium dendrobatidis]|nr:DnaJ subfamily C member 24 [Batrachochytrium dendrobatidis]